MTTLSYSRAFYLEFFFDQRLENFLQAHVNACAWFGGVPRHLLYDNLKSVVLARHGDAIRFQPRLLEAGASLIVIEHNLDVIKTADWIIDLGPEGGIGGGEVVAVGTPEDIMKVAASHTGRFLKQHLSQR